MSGNLQKGSQDHKSLHAKGPQDPLTQVATTLVAIAPYVPPEVAHILYIAAAALPLVKPAARLSKRAFRSLRTVWRSNEFRRARILGRRASRRV